MPDEALIRQFLGFCLRGKWDFTALQAAREIAASGALNWDLLREVIKFECLEPLLYRIVRDRDVVPAFVEREWQDAYYRNACHNTLLLRELEIVLRHLAVRDVNAIVLKGAALAETVYGDIGVRSMSDLDILIQPRDLPVARLILAQLGYAAIGVDMQVGFTEDFRNEESHLKGGLIEIWLDLHWRLLSPVYYQRTLSTNWFWETALPTQINASPTLILGNEAQIIYLCSHLMLHHGGRSLLWLHDVAEVITLYQTQINWDLVLTKAKEYNLIMCVRQILLQVADEWKVPIPINTLEKLRILTPPRQEVQIYTWQHRNMALRLFADFVGAKDWRQGLHIVWNTLFPTRTYMEYRYHILHPILLPLYYLYRLFLALKRVPQNVKE